MWGTVVYLWLSDCNLQLIFADSLVSVQLRALLIARRKYTAISLHASRCIVDTLFQFLKRTNFFESSLLQSLCNALFPNMIQKSTIEETAENINHQSFFLLFDKFVQTCQNVKEDRARARVREGRRWERRNPIVFPLSFIPAINLDGYLDMLADLAEKIRDA